MLVKGELAAEDVLTCVLAVLRTERAAGVVEPFLALALRAAGPWTPGAVPHGWSGSPSVGGRLAESRGPPAAGAAHAGRRGQHEEHFALLDRGSRRRPRPRLAGAGPPGRARHHDQAAVEALLERDPDPDAWLRALGVTAARPDEDAKDEVWAELFVKRSVPAGQPMLQLAACFWRPVQHDLLVPWAHRYLDEARPCPAAACSPSAG